MTTRQALSHIRQLYPTAFPATIFHETALRVELLYQIELVYAPQWYCCHEPKSSSTTAHDELLHYIACNYE